MRTANEYFASGSYSDAAFEYEAAMQNRLRNKGVWRLAESYRLSGDLVRAEEWYRKAVDYGYGPDDRNVFLADAYIRNGRFEQARVLLEDRLKTHPEDPQARKLISVYRNRTAFFNDSASWSISRIPIDPPSTDLYSPVLMRGGLLVVSDMAADGVTASRRCSKAGCCADLFYIRETPLGHWFDPEPLRGAVNGFLNEGPACFNAGGDTLYFTRNRYTNSLEQRGKGGRSLLRIYVAAFADGEWSVVGEIPLAKGVYSAAHPALSPDGNSLVFSSDQMSRGRDFDLMVATRLMDGSWSEPRFIDGGVNTQGNEAFPVFSAGGQFHFASDGQPGLGGLDIFRAELYQDSAANCVNAGAPFNTGGDDFGLVFDSTGRVAYLSSSRGGIRDRLYKVVRKIPNPEYRFDVSNGFTPLPLCTLTVQAAAVDSVLITDQLGAAHIRLAKGADVSISVRAPGYLVQRFLLKVPLVPDSPQIVHPVVLSPIPYLEPVVWLGIDFLKKQPEFPAESYPALERLAEFLEDNVDLIVEIAVYTDARDKESANRALTELRCQRIARFLVAKGISSARFRLKPAGESGIRNRCRNGVHCNEEEHAFNNRVEVTVERIPALPLTK